MLSYSTITANDCHLNSNLQNNLHKFAIDQVKSLGPIPDHKGWICLMQIKNHKLLMRLMPMLMPVHRARHHIHRIEGASIAASFWWPPLAFANCWCLERVPKQDTSNDEGPPGSAVTCCIAVLVTGVLMTFACSPCKVDPIAIHAPVTSPVIKTPTNNFFCIFGSSAMQQKFLAYVFCQHFLHWSIHAKESEIRQGGYLEIINWKQSRKRIGFHRCELTANPKLLLYI